MKTGHGGRSSSKALPLELIKKSKYDAKTNTIDLEIKVKNSAPFGQIFKGISIQLRDNKNRPIGEFLNVDDLKAMQKGKGQQGKGQQRSRSNVQETTNINEHLKTVDCRDCFKQNNGQEHMTAKSCLSHRSAKDKTNVRFTWKNTFGYTGKVEIHVTVVESYMKYWENKVIDFFFI